MRIKANTTKAGKPALYLTTDELREIALERGQEQIRWLHRRGFDCRVIEAAMTELCSRPGVTYPSDIEILEKCEEIARQVYPRVELVHT